MTSFSLGAARPANKELKLTKPGRNEALHSTVGLTKELVMSGLSATIVLALLVGVGAQPVSVTTAKMCEPAVTLRQDIWHGLPESFYDQGRASIPAMYPHFQLLADRRQGQLANIDYSLLAFQTTPEAAVQLEAVAVDWNTKRAWDVKATCAPDKWPNGLIAMLEAIAVVR